MPALAPRVSRPDTTGGSALANVRVVIVRPWPEKGWAARPRVWATTDDLAALLLYERDRADQALTEALLDGRSIPGSPVRDAADRLLRAHAPWALDLAGAAAQR